MDLTLPAEHVAVAEGDWARNLLVTIEGCDVSDIVYALRKIGKLDELIDEVGEDAVRKHFNMPRRAK